MIKELRKKEKVKPQKYIDGECPTCHTPIKLDGDLPIGSTYTCDHIVGVNKITPTETIWKTDENGKLILEKGKPIKVGEITHPDIDEPIYCGTELEVYE